MHGKQLKVTIFVGTLLFIGITIYSIVLKKENESWDGTESQLKWELNNRANWDLPEENFVNDQQDHVDSHRLENSTHLKLEPKEPWENEETSKPKHWHGLPLSKNNDLYKEPNEAMNIKKIDLQIKIEQKKNFTKSEIDEIIEEFASSLGWNGILDILDNQYQNNLTQAEKQRNLGSYYHLGLRALEKARHYRHAVEITSRSQLNKSPLKAVIFESMVNTLDINQIHAAKQLIDSELCFFKYKKKFGDQYISCLEGVGQGIGYIKKDNFDEATEICDLLFEDVDDKYTCTSGLFMGIIPKFPDASYSPCDIAKRFPAACFKLKRNTFSLLRTLTNPCKTIEDDYHYRACIYGEAYLSVIVNASHPMGNARYTCRKYELNEKRPNFLHDFATCVDGFYTTHHINSFPKEVIPVECAGFENTTEVVEICEKHANIPLDGITFTDPPTYQKYPWQLLEEAYNEDFEPVAARWPQIVSK